MRARWLMPAMTAALACVLSCQPGDSEPALDLEARTVTSRVPVYLIAPGDSGASGRKVGCGDDRAVPVIVGLPRPMPALEGALRALLDLQSNPHEATGFANPLYASDLKLERIERAGAEVRVHLTGYLEVGGECDGTRLLAQLTETALQFPDVQRAQFLLDDKPLRDLLPQER